MTAVGRGSRDIQLAPIATKKAPRPGSSARGKHPCVWPWGKALRGRENNPATLHCAEQPARSFY
jgi:hypothetical protein